MMKAVLEDTLGSSEVSHATRRLRREANPRTTHGQMTYRILHEFPPAAIECRWRQLLSQVKLASHYTSPEYFLEPYFEGRRPFAIVALDGEAAVGVLTGMHEGNTVTCGLSTRPQIQIHPESESVKVLRALAQGLADESRGAALVSIYSWEWLPLEPLEEQSYRRRTLEGNPVLDLKLGAAELLKRCDLKRRNIRHAVRHGVEVSPAQSREDYQVFYKIYADWCASKSIDCAPYEIEERAFRETAGNRRLLLARHSGKIIAGSVFRFFPGGLVEYSRNSSLPEFQSLRPNDLLMWRGIEWGCENGFSLFSMGASHRFLRGFGGSMVPIIRYRQDRTFLRRHDRREQLADTGRKYIGKLPPVWEKRIRAAIGKQLQVGW